MFENIEMNEESKPLKRIVMKEELVVLTGDTLKAMVLNQFIYWSERTKTAASFVEEEMKRLKEYSNGDTSVLAHLSEDLHQGWIYKSGEDMIEDTMITVSKTTMNRMIKSLVENNWICRRKNPRYAGDNKPQYRVNLLQIQIDLYKIGYNLDGYRIIMNFVDLAKIENLQDKVLGQKTSNKPINDASVQNEPVENQSEPHAVRNESQLVQNDFRPNQIEPTLPENTSKITPESTSKNLKNDDDEKYINKGAREEMDQNEILQELIRLTSNNPDYKNLLKTLRLTRVEPNEILKILQFFESDPTAFDKDVIKQQLTWMAQKSNDEIGVSVFATYFINGMQDRLKSKNIDCSDLDSYLGIDKEELPYVPMYNWLEPDK